MLLTSPESRNSSPESEKPTSEPPRQSSGWKPTLDAYEPSLQQAARACAKFVADMELGRTPYWLTLMGPTGTGKTMLMKQVFDQARRINPGNPINNPIWPPDWERALLKTYEGGRPYCIWLEEARFAKRLREGEYDLPENLRTDFLVAYDELGGARDPSNFISEALARLAQTRLRHWMLFTSNLTLQEIGDRIDPRVSSRLIRDDNVLVQFRARDYAMRKLERVA